MITGKIPKNEPQRLAKLRSLDILDTLEEEAYDDLTYLAAKICETTISLVSLVDDSRQWFKSHYGLDARETPREQAFCAHAINQDDLLIVENTMLDDRFKDNPLVTGSPDIRFYAGAPLILEDDVRVGTLCVIDTQPRILSDDQKSSLKALSRQVVAQLKLRLKLKEMVAFDKAKDDFLSVVSHELRTPTTSLYGSLKILEKEAERIEAPVRPMVDIAVRNSEQLLNIVNDILDVATIESGKLNVVPSRVDLFEVAKNSLELNQAYLDQYGCTAELKSSEGSAAIFVYGDKQRLLQVATNLISNAAKFSNKNGKFIVGLKVADDFVEFSVTDFGVGIAPADQNKLFKKFQQFGFDKNQYHQGTGLGLTITKHILEAHHSKIEFESVPGETTKFFFKLPVK